MRHVLNSSGGRNYWKQIHQVYVKHQVDMFHDPIVDLSDPGWCAWFVFCLVFLDPFSEQIKQTSYESQQKRDSFIRNSFPHTRWVPTSCKWSEITPIHGLYLDGFHCFFSPLCQWSYRTVLFGRSQAFALEMSMT